MVGEEQSVKVEKGGGLKGIAIAKDLERRSSELRMGKRVYVCRCLYEDHADDSSSQPALSKEVSFPLSLLRAYECQRQPSEKVEAQPGRTR